MERCDRFIPGHKGVGTQCILTKGHQDSKKPEYAVCCADAATLLHRAKDGKYLDKPAKP